MAPILPAAQKRSTILGAVRGVDRHPVALLDAEATAGSWPSGSTRAFHSAERDLGPAEALDEPDPVRRELGSLVEPVGGVVGRSGS